MRIIAEIYDITMTINAGMIVYPGDSKVCIEEVVQISKGDNCNVSSLSFGSHTGTHVDVPKHFIDEGKTLEEVTPDRFMGKAKVLDMQNKVSIKRKDLINKNIEKGDFILFKTDNSKHLKSDEFNKDFIYLTEDGAKYLAEKEIGLVGIDYLSIEDYYATESNVHLTLLGNDIIILEGINLTDVKEGEYQLIALPLKIKEGNGSPVRAILIE